MGLGDKPRVALVSRPIASDCALQMHTQRGAGRVSPVIVKMVHGGSD